MNVDFLIAAATLLFLGAMHTARGEWTGDRRLVRRILESPTFDRRDPGDEVARRVVRLAWHATSLAWGGIAAVLAHLAFVELSPPVVATARILAAVFLAHAVLSLAIVRGRHPSWILFSVVALFSFLGTTSIGCSGP